MSYPKRVFQVIVKDGWTTNLEKNYRVFDGDKEPAGFASGESAVPLPDGEYPSNVFDYVLQHDDSKDVWVMCMDTESALNRGWPTRGTLYYWKEEAETEGNKAMQMVEQGYKRLQEIQDRNEQRHLSNERIMAEYPVQDEFWPSRRWKEDGSDYCDLSGFEYEDDYAPILTTDTKLRVVQEMIDIIRKDHPEFDQRDTTGWDLMQWAHALLAEYKKQKLTDECMMESIML